MRRAPDWLRIRRKAKPTPRGFMANTSSMVVARIVVGVLSWAGTVIIIRHLSHTEWGEYTFVFSFLSLLAIVSNVVESRVVLHDIMHGDSPRVAGTYILLRGAMGLLAYTLALAFVVLAGYSSTVVTATAVGGIVVLLATPSVGYDAIFTTHMRMDRVAVALVLGQIVQLALTAILAISGAKVVVLMVPAVLSEVVTLWWKLRHLPKLQAMRYVPDIRRWGRMLKDAVPLAIGSGAAMLFTSLDSVMLSKLDTFRAVGTYGIAYKFAGIVGSIPPVLCGVLLAMLIRSLPDDSARFFDSLRRASVTLLALSLLITTEFMLFSAQAIRLLYGANYVAATGATRLVISAECLGFFSLLAITVFASIGRNRLYPIAAVAGLLVNFTLNLILIPRYSFHGAAWVTLGTELLVVIILWVPLLRLLDQSPIPMGIFLRAVGVTACAGGVGYGAKLVTWWPFAAVLSTLVFLVGLHFVRVPDRGGLIGLFRDGDPVPMVPAPLPEVR